MTRTMRRRPRITAGVLLGGGLIAGMIANGLLVSMSATPAATAYAETLGFAVTIPAWLVILTYAMSGFDFPGYYGTHSKTGLAGDIGLAILAAGAAGLVGTGLIVETLGPGLIADVIAGITTLGAAFTVFIFRTGAYQAGVDES